MLSDAVQCCVADQWTMGYTASTGVNHLFIGAELLDLFVCVTFVLTVPFPSLSS